MQKIKKLDLNLNVITKGDRCLEWAGGKILKIRENGGCFQMQWNLFGGG